MRRFLAEAAPISSLRELWDGDAGCDARLWTRLREELGLPGLAVAEAQGGQGFGMVELGLAQAELGRALAATPFFATAVLAGRAAAHAAAGDAREELLTRIAAGERMALAWVEPGRGWDPAELALQARPAGGAWTLDGAKHLVVDGHTAERVLVAARAPGSRGEDGIALFSVAGDAPGLARRRQDSLDRSRALARLDFTGVRGRRVCSAGAAGPGLARALDDAAALLAAEMAGGLERVLESASEHARTRVQFGRPIGAFQAVKHLCADVLIALEGARSGVRAALEAADAGDAEAPALASLAKAWAGDAFVHGAEANVQIHGGVGFTWEYDAHLFLRRALSSRELLGDAAHHRERIARGLAA